METTSPTPPTTPTETKPLATEKKKPGRKKKPVIPIKIVHYDTPYVLTFD